MMRSAEMVAVPAIATAEPSAIIFEPSDFSELARSSFFGISAEEPIAKKAVANRGEM